MRFVVGFLVFLLLSVGFLGLVRVVAPQVSFLESFSRDGVSLSIPQFSVFDAIVSSEKSEGFFEFNITLVKLPVSNSWFVPFVSEGLVFYYQPALDEELKVDGVRYDFVNATHGLFKGEVVVYRPEDVVGSYAVYREDGKTGNNYLTGKVCHIYRPLIVDAMGGMVWGVLSVDKSGLRITVDAVWLAGAVYPVVIDPTFGYGDIGGTQINSQGSWSVASLYSLSEAGSATNITAYLYGGGGNAYQSIYGDNAGVPDDRLGTKDGAVAEAWGWREFTFDIPIDLVADDYWLSFTNAYGKYDSGGSYYQVDGGVPPPDPWVGGASESRMLSIYATYTASGGDVYVGSVSSVLNAPVDDAEIDYLACKFNYTAQLVGNSSDYFSNSTLYVNNTAVAYNASAIVNNTLSTMSYTLAGNGTYVWDVLVWNNTQSVWSGNGNFTLVVGVVEGAVTLEELNNAVWMVALLCMGFCLMVTAVYFKRRSGS